MLALLFAAAALAVQTAALYDEITGHDGGRAGAYDRRLAALRAELPRGSILGYLSAGESNSEQFFLTRYALAPHPVIRSAAPDTIILIHPETWSPDSIARNHNREVLRIIDSQTVLLRRSDG
ncbi:MAG: hypothetical protein GF355_04100 [Candidatus Eisenbacteria bacterium]|nr:hypothetical protein [Candidatus Eisenbacteria bacterium]